MDPGFIPFSNHTFFIKVSTTPPNPPAKHSCEAVWRKT